jgi:rhomboid protease GluP
MVRLGANAPALVAKGEWYRVVTANLLHADARHLVSNALALLLLGAAAEGMMGTGRFFIVLLASFLAGASCSAVAACAELSVGASTGVYGLFAAIELLSWRFRDRVPRIPRVLRRLAVLAFALNVLLALSLPGVDAVAHAGGLVAGGLTAGALYAFGSPLGPREPLSRTARAVLAALSAVFAVGLALGVRAAWTGSEADELQVVAGIASREVDPNLLNNLAWGYAKDPASSSHALEVVRPLSEKAVAGKPEDAQLQDTLATVYYRLGRLDEAIDREWQAFHLEAKPYFATQLARFLRARQGGGPPLLRGGARESDVRVRIEGSGEGEAPSRWIAVDLPRGLSKGAAVFAHVREPRGREVGLLTLELGAMGSRALRLTDNRNASLAYLPEDAQVDVALIDAGGVDRESGETWWRFDPMDPKVAALP